MGYALLKTDRFNTVDALIPLPLHPAKEHMRGYNQAALICEGINETWHRPVLSDAITRTRFTETQTRQNRISRSENMEGAFTVPNPNLLRDKHVLLVDDVITTGASLEACGSAILRVEGVSLSVATAAYTI